jgi:hypothetical protein
MPFRYLFVVLLNAIVLACVVAPLSHSQSTNASVNGVVLDTSGASIPSANVQIINEDTNAIYPSTTNKEGVYSVPDLPPGRYRIQVSKPSFKTLIKPDIILNVLDAKAINFTLTVGAASETVTVEAGVSMVDTQDGTVSTVVDRQFAENLPMNGRSFQTLIELTPGVTLTVSSAEDNGQFSVNGQRASSNYWMVDGVSANIGIGSANSAAAGNGLSGASASFSVLGGTNSLVSVDAMQEFRIQTSTYAPEFGRTPGGQISIVTRSGTNQFHGTVFDYFRNTVLDANNWFADEEGLPKPKEEQNDFGGTFSGPIVKDKTFFFFSYEGLRLRLPQTVLSTVPDLSARQNATPAMQPFLNAFPLPTPNSPDDVAAGIAQFNASYSNPASLDAYSLRVDHKLNDRLHLFGRYNYSPSELVERGGSGFALSTVFPSRITTQTATLGATWAVSPVIADDLRFNYSRTGNNEFSYFDSFGGAIPLDSLPFPSPFTIENGSFQFYAFDLLDGLNVGPQGHNVQRQINIVDTLSIQKGSHALKFGVDFRRLTPLYGNPAYDQEALFSDVPSEEVGSLVLGIVTSSHTSIPLVFRNFGAFAQDTWRVLPRLTVTYGLRWDVDFAPTSTPSLLAVTGFNLENLSNLALAPAGTPPFQTTYGNIAPRLGVAYEISQNGDWQTVLRSGFGVFYDLATSEVGNNIASSAYPFGGIAAQFGGNFPLSPAAAAPPPITSAALIGGNLYAFDPHLQLPYTLQWNVALEQGLGGQQTISASYIGAVGRRLIQSAQIESPNPNFGAADLVTNAATSSYNALQLQFQRRLSRGLQFLASYTWSHSIDTASAGSLYGNEANALVPGLNPNSNRGPSDFDIRNAFSAGLTYDVPTPRIESWAKAIMRGWSLQSVIQARSALPVNVYDFSIFTLSSGAVTFVRPDLVPGQPLYLFGSQYPGGKAFNPAAFVPPPEDSNGNALSQGDTPRNYLRGFGAAQWDFSVHRDFPIHESVTLQFRAEMFNVLNHPNFAPPVGDISSAQFGLSTETLGQYLAGGNVGNGGFSPLYQIGGPRSVQFALKLQF